MKSLKNLAKTALIVGATSSALSGCDYFEKFFIPECDSVKAIEMTASSANGYPELKYNLQGNFVNVLKIPAGNDFIVKYEHVLKPNVVGKLIARDMKFRDDEGNLCYLNDGKLYNPRK